MPHDSTSEPEEALRLEKITTRFVAAEDRLRLDGQAPSGRVVVLWVTQRLMRRVVPVLLRHVSATLAGQPLPEVRHEFAQAAARAAHRDRGQQAPVVPDAEAAASGWRVETVEVTAGQGGITLSLRGEKGEAARLFLAFGALRVWINILHDVWRQAEWPTDVWPEWVTQAAPGTRDQTALPLH
jgi:hypothetical protein